MPSLYWLVAPYQQVVSPLPGGVARQVLPGVGPPWEECEALGNRALVWTADQAKANEINAVAGVQYIGQFDALLEKFSDQSAAEQNRLKTIASNLGYTAPELARIGQGSPIAALLWLIVSRRKTPRTSAGTILVDGPERGPQRPLPFQFGGAAPGGFPSLNTILDNFNRANGGVGANWSPIYTPGAFNSMAVDTNQAKNAGDVGANHAPFFWNPTIFGQDQEANIVVPVLPSEAGQVSFYMRLSQTGNTATVDGYIVAYTFFGGSSDAIQIFRLDNGTPTQLGGNDFQDLVAGEKFGYQALGPNITAFYTVSGVWTPVSVRSDATYGSGNIGVNLENVASLRVDDFSAGDFVPPFKPDYSDFPEFTLRLPRPERLVPVS